MYSCSFDIAGKCGSAWPWEAAAGRHTATGICIHTAAGGLFSGTHYSINGGFSGGLGTSTPVVLQLSVPLLPVPSLEQLDKPFLREMVVVSQDFADAFLPHPLHRNAVDKAVALVRAGFIKAHA
jgi:hypothetical protein